MTVDATNLEVDTKPATLDVVGLGNALVDVLSHEADDFLSEYGLVKGSMDLIDTDRAELLYGAMGPATEISGGSAANTMVGVASFGGTSAFVGRVRDDSSGKRVRPRHPRGRRAASSGARRRTGQPTRPVPDRRHADAERTLNTYLGAAAEFGPEDVEAERGRGRAGHVPRGLPLGPAARQGRVPGRGAPGSRGRPARRADALGRLLRRPSPRRLPRPGRARRRHPVRQRVRDLLAVPRSTTSTPRCSG